MNTTAPTPRSHDPAESVVYHRAANSVGWHDVFHAEDPEVVGDWLQSPTGDYGAWDLWRLGDGGGAWVVADTEGAVHVIAALPPLPPRLTRWGATTWEVAWEDPRAEADDLLAVCEGVDRRVLVRAACACARTVLPVWEARYPGDLRPRRALEVADAWTWGEATVQEVKDATDAAYAAYAADAAAYAAARAVARRALAPIVRLYIPLGMVLLAQAGRAS